MIRADRLRAISYRATPAAIALVTGLILTAIGIEAIRTVRPVEATKQMTWMVAALIAMGVSFVPRPKELGMLSYLLFAGVLGVLVVMIMPGVPRSIVPVINGARAWIDLKVMRVQPSEIAKITFVLALAWYLRNRESYRTLRGLLIPFGIMFLPVGLILKQPDLGTALLFAPVLFAVLIAAGAKLRHMFALVGIGLLAIGLNVAVIVVDPPHLTENRTLPSWMHVLKPHQEKRIASMVWPERYKSREAFQPMVARRMVGAGAIAGVGAERAETLIRWNRLPEPHNDMIYAVLVNRWGLGGGLAVIGLYVVLFLALVGAASRTKDPFARLSIMGFNAMLFTQAALNIGVVLGLLPTTGVTLPFVSYGGSSLISCFMMLALTLNLSIQKPAIIIRPSFEFDRPDPATE